VSRLTTS
jgi:putative transposase